MSTSAARMARWQRHRTGRIPLSIEVDEVALCEALIEHGLLNRAQADDRLALAKAVEHPLDLHFKQRRRLVGRAIFPR